MNFIKKYWGLLVAFIGGILAVIFFGNQPKKDRSEIKEIKKDIKESEKKETAIENSIKVVEKQKEKTKTDIKKSDDKIKDLENKISDVKSDKTNPDEAAKFLKDFAKKNRSKKPKNPKK